MFGGKKTEAAPLKTSGVVSTGGEIDGIVNALINGANDTDESVRLAIAESLHDIGFRQPRLVISSCCNFLAKNLKADKAHRIILLKLIYQILEEKREDISEDLGATIIEVAIAEMTREKEVVPDWQQAASSVFVTLGVKFPNQIMKELLQRFEPGSIPHYFIMKTLGDFVAHNAMSTVPRLREVFSRVLPVLSAVKQDNMKWVFAASVGHFCEAVSHYVANIDQGSDKSISQTSFSADVYPAYELMFTKWISSGEPKIRLATVQAVCSMCAVLSRDQFEAQVAKVITGIVQMYKKEKDLLRNTHSLCSILDCGLSVEG
eukprot:TRINITY_DN21543_c0_g1_i1.p1 TRINITY_DN21543_c0_g1~~TRINITY_DN21543_c0_g1_i1.p1  ORF type:complete len:318 (+),score=64.37 TRINITY_DN21543_c0_g1_i1:59-1012(+)